MNINWRWIMARFVLFLCAVAILGFSNIMAALMGSALWSVLTAIALLLLIYPFCVAVAAALIWAAKNL